ncbi:mitochondrial intermembrane space import and assembly protein 40 homolog [Cornus florida]|uniref:mitochondrial intermembrane space import and assembly protein 40 homolog n=1 Tax=Cornus florida TaxID=4283 RepID=UPI002896AABF|nr:mitochondrial intermembrane space import and assembly protein 40 homolog [Cornus florida]
MGQVQSDVADAATVDQGKHSSSSSSATDNNTQPASLESLIAEAAAFGDDENESLDAKAQKALECPCIADLRKGPCGTQFSESFLCFLKSTAEEKGSDCVHPFVALQHCIKANPDAFSKDVLDDNSEVKKEEESEVKKEEERSRKYKIIPPIWSVESKSPKHKL